MSRSSADIPPSARDISLILASTPAVSDAQPAVLHQLLEFGNRYAAQVLADALVFAEHANRVNKLETDDVILAVQARVGWELGGRVPKDYIMSLATQTNAQALPPVPEVFGVRLPPEGDRLTAVDFNLVPNKPPPTIQQYDEEIEEIEDLPSDEDEDDDDMEPAPIPAVPPTIPTLPPTHPVGGIHTPSDVDMIGVEDAVVPNEQEEGSDEDEEGLFAGGDEDEEGMEEVVPTAESAADGVKRKLVEDDDYD